MKPNTSKRTLTALVFVALALGALVAIASVGGAAASVQEQSNNQTVAADNDCEDLGPPTMSQSRLYAAEKTIDSDQEGTIEGAFRVDPTEAGECDIVVDVEMLVPSGIEIAGGSDFEQMGGGIVTGTFEASPGELRDIRAHVHATSDDMDEATVIADYEIWYKGNPENSYQQDGLRFTFDIEDTNEPDEEGEAEESNVIPIDIEWGLVGLLALLIVALLVVAKKDVIVNVVRRN